MKESSKKPKRNRANFGLNPKDMTPEQRKNWERVNKKKESKEEE